MIELQLPLNEIVCGDAFQVLKTLPDESIDLTMFSPPYWGLRDYGVAGQIGLEEDPSKYVEKVVEICQQVKRLLLKSGSMYIVIGDTYWGGGQGGRRGYGGKNDWKPEMGDFYPSIAHGTRSNWLQPKQLLGIPWRVAIALQGDGWILRNDIIWNKPNHLPSSVKDRLSNAYEHIFHFVKSRRYYYDLDSIREKLISSRASGNRERKPSLQPNRGHVGRSIPWSPTYRGKFKDFGEKAETYGSPRARNERPMNKIELQILDLWPKIMKEYASIPDIEIEEFKGKCSQLGPQDNFRRVQLNERKGRVRFEKALDKLGIEGNLLRKKIIEYWHNHHTNPLGKNPGDVISVSKQYNQAMWLWKKARRYSETPRITHPLGKAAVDFWSINTKPFKGAHFAVYPEAICIRPIKSSSPPNGVVLDPMCGSGTTCLVARKLCRNYIGIELNPAYVEVARKRLATIPERPDMIEQEEVSA